MQLITTTLKDKIQKQADREAKLHQDEKQHRFCQLLYFGRINEYRGSTLVSADVFDAIAPSQRGRIAFMIADNLLSIATVIFLTIIAHRAGLRGYEVATYALIGFLAVWTLLTWPNGGSRDTHIPPVVGLLTLLALPGYKRFRRKFSALYDANLSGEGVEHLKLLQSLNKGQLSLQDLSMLRVMIEAECLSSIEEINQQVRKTEDAVKALSDVEDIGDLKTTIKITLATQIARLEEHKSSIKKRARAFRDSFGHAQAEVEKIGRFQAAMRAIHLAEYNDNLLRELALRQQRMESILTDWQVYLQSAEAEGSALVKSIPEIASIYTPPLEAHT